MDLRTKEGVRTLAVQVKKVLDNVSNDPEDYNSLCESALQLIPLLGSLAFAKGSSLLMRRQGEYEAVVATKMEYFQRLSGTNQQKLVEGHEFAKEVVALNETIKSLDKDVQTAAELLRTVISIKKVELDKGLIGLNNTRNDS